MESQDLRMYLSTIIQQNQEIIRLLTYIAEEDENEQQEVPEEQDEVNLTQKGEEELIKLQEFENEYIGNVENIEREYERQDGTKTKIKTKQQE